MSKLLKPKPVASAEGPSEEKHHKYRCHDLKRQLDELEEYNELLAIKLFRSQKRLHRMKIERNILLERFERTRHDPLHSRIDDSASESDSDAPLKDTFPRPPAAASDSEHALRRSASPAATTSSTARGRRKGVALQHPRGALNNNLPSSTASTPLLPPIDAVTPHAASTRKPRSDKDPNAPKRPANAFVLYCQNERPSIKSAGTEMNSGELTRALAGTWKNLPKSERQKYFDLYEREMDRYHQEFAKYKISLLAAASRDGVGGVAASTAISESSTVVVPSAFADTSSRDDDLDAADIHALDDNDEDDNRANLNDDAADAAKHFDDDDDDDDDAAVSSMSASAAGSLGGRPESPHHNHNHIHHIPPANGTHTPLSHNSASPIACSPTADANDLAPPPSSASATVSGQL
ncbi:non-histone protein [Coemansia sp. BCRC 34301]|nr:non-histone protein [Coemansia sp. BCRC 34301]